MRAAGRWSARRKSRLILTPETGAAIGWRECAMLLSRCRSTTKVNTTAAIFGGRNASQTDKACQGTHSPGSPRILADGPDDRTIGADRRRYGRRRGREGTGERSPWNG